MKRKDAGTSPEAQLTECSSAQEVTLQAKVTFLGWCGGASAVPIQFSLFMSCVLIVCNMGELLSWAKETGKALRREVGHVAKIPVN